MLDMVYFNLWSKKKYLGIYAHYFTKLCDYFLAFYVA
jgi:hypothetical protein